MRMQKGSLTLEASIALVVFIFFIMTFIGFNVVYRAQGAVSHATLQTAQSLAVSCYLRETVSSEKTVSSVQSFLGFVERLFGSSFSFDDQFQSLGASGMHLESQARNTFWKAIAGTETEADEKLKSLGVVDGLSGIVFSGCKVENNEVLVIVSYKVKIPYTFFGNIEIPIKKAAITHTFKKVS